MLRKALPCTALLAFTLLSAPAFAHVERASYWPDPAADCTIKPCTGGAVPKARSLASALNTKLPGSTRVVCQPDSLKLLNASIRSARKHGYDIRPTDHRRFGKTAATKLRKTNARLFKRCRFHDIQSAVTASHNNDRVVVMPGLYTEPASRAKPTNDPACEQYKINNERSGGAVSYAYQSHCPNDQNLVAVLGRAVGSGTDPDPPLEDRHNIPNLGPCIRCNLQLEGSGVSADDVVVDAGNAASGNGPPLDPAKDVGIRVDRADGFVLRNMTVRHAKEHDVYVLESDGYLLDRFKVFWGGEYGVLTFVEDHGLIQNCEAAGSSDSGLYPGAGADTGAERDTKYYPEFRYSQEMRYCDSHHSLSGYSGTDGNATHVHHNNFYDNALGFTTDVFTAPGHPGFPQDSDLIEYNNFYSNNFNVYDPKSGISASEPEPVGTGLWIAGGNHNVIRFNRFYDNWRRATMVFAAPDATICAPAIGTPVTGCDPSKFSTSYDNVTYGNVMGVAPDGKAMPNGTDFWWDSYPTNTGNCWYQNKPAPGASITTSPSPLPDCSDGQNPGSSMGTGDAGNEGELAGCLLAIESGQGYNPDLCPWFVTPPKPGSPGAREQEAAMKERQRQAFLAYCAQHQATATCTPFVKPLGGL